MREGECRERGVRWMCSSLLLLVCFRCLCVDGIGSSLGTDDVFLCVGNRNNIFPIAGNGGVFFSGGLYKT